MPVVDKPKHAGGRPTDYKGEETIKKVYEYLADRQDTKEEVKVPTKQGLARFLDCNIDTIQEWSKIYPEFSVALGDLEAEQHDRVLGKGLGGSYNPTIAKLVLSNNHGYQEKQEHEHKGSVTLNIAKEIYEETN